MFIHFGGLGGPIAATGVLPDDRDGDVDAEYSCQDDGGQFGGGLEQCGGAGVAGVEPEAAESFAESGGAERAARREVARVSG
jgi:hypothetical protein